MCGMFAGDAPPPGQRAYARASSRGARHPRAICMSAGVPSAPNACSHMCWHRRGGILLSWLIDMLVDRMVSPDLRAYSKGAFAAGRRPQLCGILVGVADALRLAAYSWGCLAPPGLRSSTEPDGAHVRTPRGASPPCEYAMWNHAELCCMFVRDTAPQANRKQRRDDCDTTSDSQDTLQPQAPFAGRSWILPHGTTRRPRRIQKNTDNLGCQP